MEGVDILIIEDSAVFAEYLSEIIKKEGYRTTIAETGKLSFSFLNKHQYNLVLLDMELPDCSGTEILKHIRRKYNQTELPVIFISATTDEQKIIEALESGANDFISKPFSEITLKIKIKNLLQLHFSGIQIVENLKIREEQNSRLQKLTDELSQAIKDKDLFISILAHDLKSPFNALLGFSDLLIANLRSYGMDEIEKQLKVIHKTSHQTYALLEDLLLWSKAQAGILPFQPEEIIFEKVSLELINDLKYQADIKQIEIKVIQQVNNSLFVDLQMFKTILRNLVSNAMKFTHPHGKISILATNQNGKMIVSVADNGTGMDEETKSKLFIASQPYSTRGTTGEKGTGLGLLLCKNFVEKHGGEIWVESEAGKGSNFQFTIPDKNS
jgi:two-component system, sensor histidine kinase and response regulator